MLREFLLHFTKRNVGLFAALLSILAVGTVGYSIIGGGRYSIIDCLYMTVITVTTIGYGEIIDLSHSPAGRVFTMFVALSGIGIAAYFLSNVVDFMVEGRLQEAFWRRKMEREIGRLRQHYIVCGVEGVGSYIVKELYSTKRPYVIVDNDKARTERTIGGLRDELFVEGDATDSDILNRAGINEALGLFAVTGDDNENLVISLTAKTLNSVIKVIAACNDLKNMEKIKKAGADAVVSPSYIGGLRIVSEMVRPTVVSFLDTMMRDKEENLRIEEISVSEAFVDRPIKSLDLKKHPNVLLLAIKAKERWIYNPDEAYVLRQDDTLIIMTTPCERSELEKIFL
ncbi:MAG: potassium channel family protein [Thermodesulfobacteriota bacterium]